VELLHLDPLIAENLWQIQRSATSGATGNSIPLFEQYELQEAERVNSASERTIKEMASYFAPGDTLAHFRPILSASIQWVINPLVWYLTTRPKTIKLCNYTTPIFFPI
jgi:hypothetical protein